MTMTPSDLSARLLATENITVVRARAQTASFDIKNRVLTIPSWKDMTPQIEDMLIGHEVGHALYTDESFIPALQENANLKSYINVVEDVRIEKLIKRKYPGLRKFMTEGYRQLNERDFFGVKSIQDLNELNLIDKINLYFKVGLNCGIKFNSEEKQFVIRAEKTETPEEVIQLARDIFDYSKANAEKSKKYAELNSEDSDDEFENSDMDVIDGEYSDIDEFDSDTEISEESQNEGFRKSNEGSGKGLFEQTDELESKTERVFQSKLNDLADNSTQYVYWKFTDKFHPDTVIDYKRILRETKTPEQWNNEASYYDRYTRYMSEEERANYFSEKKSDVDKFKADSSRTVEYLVKEFEMRKSAQMYKRAQISKSGSLNMSKVFAYKINEDIFKRVTTLPQGKNHGMIFLLDWSGSMDQVLQDTLKQVINLAMFCNRAQIQYRVYAFTSSYEQGNFDQARAIEYNEWVKASYNKEGNWIRNTVGFNMLELFSNKMSKSEFNSMVSRVLDPRFQNNDGYSIGGTPLNEALVWTYYNIEEFIKTTGIEKMSLITLTDGDGSALYGSVNGAHRSLSKRGYDAITGPHSVKNMVQDDITHKTYEMSDYSQVQTNTILRMIKDRYNISVIGFYVCNNSKRDLSSAIRSNIPNYNGDAYALIENMRKQFRDHDFASIKNSGRDELFIIPKSSTKIVEGELEISSDSNARTIAKNFSKYLNVKKTSRVLLNRFVDYVA